ncbi:MAG TPA: dienelactone hydrolase family protein [Gammaproteobacteria bacterium]|nr:dienelactone hydrolase family protein [Gammaproteobacteria bacterium]
MTAVGYDSFSFDVAGRSRPVLRKGDGPAVVVIHELPGPTPEVLSFGDRVAKAGFTAVLPVLFGVPGRPVSRPYLLGEFARVCISREFLCLSRNRASPVTNWLRALCRHAHAECHGPGVGVVGMCFTGGFALALAAEPSVLAPVLSQPSLPLGITASHRSALGVSVEDLERIRDRMAGGSRVLGLRFSEDRFCPRARFERLRRELGEGFEAVEIDSAAGNAAGIDPRAHSVLTMDLVDSPEHPTRQALDRVIEFLRERLREDPAGR